MSFLTFTLQILFPTPTWREQVSSYAVLSCQLMLNHHTQLLLLHRHCLTKDHPHLCFAEEQVLRSQNLLLDLKMFVITTSHMNTSSHISHSILTFKRCCI